MAVDIDEARWYKRCMATASAHDRDIVRAAEAGDCAAVRALCEKAKPRHGFSVCLAAKKGHVDVVDCLLRASAPAASDESYALRHASTVDIARLLVDAGANPRACGDDGFARACGANNLELAQFLYDKGAGNHPGAFARALQTARRKGSLAVIAWLSANARVLKEEGDAFVNACGSGALQFAKELHGIGAAGGVGAKTAAISAATDNKQHDVVAWLRGAR